MFIVTAKEMYDIDHYTMHDIGLDSVLMENAGRAVSEKLISRISRQASVFVLAGGGHNGGDGFVIARTLHNFDYTATVLQTVADDKLVHKTQLEKTRFQNCGGTVKPLDVDNMSQQIEPATVIVDAITGLGIRGKLRPPLSDIIYCVNQSPARIFSVDIPSGLPADEGLTPFEAVRAEATFMIGAVKETACLAETAPYYGAWEVVDIGHPPHAFSNTKRRWMMTAEQFRQTMPGRQRDAYKGDKGKGLLIGGSHQMPGAAGMAAKATLKTGAGLLTVAAPERVINHVAMHCLEAMYKEIPAPHGEMVASDTLDFTAYDAVAIGVGMGRREETGEWFSTVLKQSDCPLVIDADGLYHLTNHLELAQQRHHPTIITPHAGEMARLLDIDIETLLAQPFYYSRHLADTYGLYVVLKGKDTIITSPEGKQAVDATGNPGLAKGGSGDVLTGICLGMVLQQRDIFQALCNACFVHGMSADIQVDQRHSVHDLMATDVIDGISAVYGTVL